MPARLPNPAFNPAPQRSRSLVDGLWERYRGHGDIAARAGLLDSYLGLVHHALKQLLPRLPAHIEYNELVSAGTVGLVQALESFDPARGNAFSSFAIPRIRGAMLDDLRKREWLPKNARGRKRQILDIRERLSQRLGRLPEAAETAEELGLDLETFRRWELDLDRGTPVMLDAPANQVTGRGSQVQEILADEQVTDPIEKLTREEQTQRLRQVLEQLPEKERLVVTLSFLEEVNLRQIGELLHISESRVSQIRTAALRRLREALSGTSLVPA
ncbi:MAG: FliA/WhiG family RNA polymerase sigma factor [Gemmatimonadota bacterium]